MESLDEEIRSLSIRARFAARALAPRPRADKDRALFAIADALDVRRDEVLAANAEDVAAAEAKGVKGPMLARLRLDSTSMAAIATSVREVAALADPVGQIISETTRPNGLRVSRVRVPLGVIAMIYEARPNVTVEASALTLKAGNAVLLKGGSEAVRSNQALGAIVASALDASGLPRDAVQVLPHTDRDAVRALIQQSEHVDLAIPRGGEALIRYVTENARVPVVQHYKGVCHLYIDAGFDAEQALAIVLDSKMRRPSACNALETLLVDRHEADRTLPALLGALRDAGCEVREGDYGVEHLDAVLSYRVVSGLDEALAHVAQHGSGHTEAILTMDLEHAARWRREVDAACVIVNGSTRFHDGGELGLGAEMLTVRDLAKFPIITFPRKTQPYESVRSLFNRPELPPIRLHASASIATVIHLAIEGLGIAVIPTAIVQHELADGRLQLLNTDLQIQPLTFSATWLASPDTVAIELVAGLAADLAQGGALVDAQA